MENEVIMGQQLTFTAPSGISYTIREQNGADDDILSNPQEARDLTNLSRFIASIVMSCSLKSGKLTVEDAKSLPVLDRYCILFKSRIFSLGADLDFEYDWGKENGGKVSYSQDLNDFLFEDYGDLPSAEEMEAKPYAIPFYSVESSKDIKIALKSGHEVIFDLMTGNSEAYILTLPLEKRTKNQELIARNLRVKVGDNWEKVTNFSNFSVKDMQEIRRTVAASDPTFMGTTTIENPHTGEKAEISIIGVSSFFYPEEM